MNGKLNQRFHEKKAFQGKVEAGNNNIMVGSGNAAVLCAYADKHRFNGPFIEPSNAIIYGLILERLSSV